MLGTQPTIRKGGPINRHRGWFLGVLKIDTIIAKATGCCVDRHG
jgi:hypothetical protein